VRGGPSNEYDVSLKSGAAVLDALDKEKYEPLDILISKSGVWHIYGVEVKPHDALRRVDAVFNALHGTYGEDGKIQQLFEAHSVPFTGSGSLSSAMAMTKHLAKEVFLRAGLKTPMHIVVGANAESLEEGIDTTKAYRLAHAKFPLPYIVKPATSGSSIGVSFVKSRDELADALQTAFASGDSVLIEECISGVEATVGVIEGFRSKDMYALPPVEIRKGKGNIFDYEAKYGGKVPSSEYLVLGQRKDNTVLGTRNSELSRSEEIVPATFSPSIKKELERLAIAAHEALGLSHYSRSDFIISPHRGIYILETNSLPGLTEESLVPKALAAVGASMTDFVDHLIELAMNE